MSMYDKNHYNIVISLQLIKNLKKKKSLGFCLKGTVDDRLKFSMK